MAAQARSGTSPEMAVRRRLHSRGLRYRVDYRPEASLRRSADVVFTRAKIAVFIDGCFWHSCPEHGTLPKTNREWWATKLTTNVARDRDTDASLEAAGWTVLRFWEHDDPDRIVAVIEHAVRRHRDPTTSPVLGGSPIQGGRGRLGESKQGRGSR